MTLAILRGDGLKVKAGDAVTLRIVASRFTSPVGKSSTNPMH